MKNLFQKPDRLQKIDSIKTQASISMPHTVTQRAAPIVLHNRIKGVDLC